LLINFWIKAYVAHIGYGQSLATNALKHLIDQLEEIILQIDQLKNASKRLQHRVTIFIE